MKIRLSTVKAGTVSGYGSKTFPDVYKHMMTRQANQRKLRIEFW
jgi:hypothetical protein